jgi:hypothetical protein
VDGAGSAGANAAAEFRTGKVQLVANDPKERRLRLDVDLANRSIYLQKDCHY